MSSEKRLINPPAGYEEEERLRLLREDGFDEVEIGVFFGASSDEEDGEEQGTFTPERIQELYRAARRLHFARGRRARGGRRRSAAPQATQQDAKKGT
ncbi:hypothetical protein Zmor_000999 [Zophobas morio]|uniref:Uncharacterized protein n=1 Tax=Zophobas morio TaxID=2755281 RepID=A0AA38IXM8_9CUCU|nr:hypothetical protein Zmor_000999 [Zophobas morio]